MKKKNDSDSWTYKDWYAKHREELSVKRRERYQSDPEYKQKVLEQNRSYRERKSVEQSMTPRPRVRIPRHRKPVLMDIKIHGVPTTKQLVHVGAFSRAIQRSVPTIHQWERLGLLPRTPFVLTGASKQERLYTAEMIQVVRQALEARYGSVSASDETFSKEIRDGWDAIGISWEDPIKENVS